MALELVCGRATIGLAAKCKAAAQVFTMKAMPAPPISATVRLLEMEFVGMAFKTGQEPLGDLVN